jgi:hypothetical protein
MPIKVSTATEPLNITVVQFTANTNFSLQTQEQLDDFTEEMKQLFLIDIQPFQEELFGDEFLVPSVEISSFEADIGDKFHKAHVHFVVTLKHKLQKYSVKKLKDRVKNWLNQQYTRSKGWYVYTVLMDFRRANYANKHGRDAANQEVDEMAEYQDEIERLSDDRQLFYVEDEDGVKHKVLAWDMESALQSLSLRD